MKQETKHTPLPWNFRKLGLFFLIENEEQKKHSIAQMNCNLSNDESNAELIVKAVNNHYALIEALKEAQELIQKHHGHEAGEWFKANQNILSAIKNAEQ
jgi:hypothetical protein